MNSKSMCVPLLTTLAAALPPHADRETRIFKKMAVNAPLETVQQRIARLRAVSGAEAKTVPSPALAARRTSEHVPLTNGSLPQPTAASATTSTTSATPATTTASSTSVPSDTSSRTSATAATNTSPTVEPTAAGGVITPCERAHVLIFVQLQKATIENDPSPSRQPAYQRLRRRRRLQTAAIQIERVPEREQRVKRNERGRRRSTPR
jgi:hypothetical protein